MTDYPLITINFMLDENQTIISRKVYTYFDVLSNLGGMMGILIAFGNVILQKIS